MQGGGLARLRVTIGDCRRLKSVSYPGKLSRQRLSQITVMVRFFRAGIQLANAFTLDPADEEKLPKNRRDHECYHH